jgi:hypothetical protein
MLVTLNKLKYLHIKDAKEITLPILESLTSKFINSLECLCIENGNLTSSDYHKLTAIGTKTFTKPFCILTHNKDTIYSSSVIGMLDILDYFQQHVKLPENSIKTLVFGENLSLITEDNDLKEILSHPILSCIEHLDISLTNPKNTTNKDVKQSIFPEIMKIPLKTLKILGCTISITDINLPKDPKKSEIKANVIKIKLELKSKKHNLFTSIFNYINLFDSINKLDFADFNEFKGDNFKKIIILANEKNIQNLDLQNSNLLSEYFIGINGELLPHFLNLLTNKKLTSLNLSLNKKIEESVIQLIRKKTPKGFSFIEKQNINLTV